MSTIAHRTVHMVQRVLLIVACIGVWLTPIVTVICFMILSQDTSLSASMAFGTVFLAAVSIEGAVIGLLLIYAVWARPWKLKGPTYDTFIQHSYAAGLTLMAAVLFVATFVR